MGNFTFIKEGNRWFVDLPSWEGDKDDLEMVFGADTMLDILAQGDDSVNVWFSLEPVNNYKFLLKYNYEEYDGCFYNLFSEDHSFDVWLCEVTKFVFGKFPKEIYIF